MGPLLVDCRAHRVEGEPRVAEMAGPDADVPAELWIAGARGRIRTVELRKRYRTNSVPTKSTTAAR